MSWERFKVILSLVTIVVVAVAIGMMLSGCWAKGSGQDPCARDCVVPASPAQHRR